MRVRERKRERKKERKREKEQERGIEIERDGGTYKLEGIYSMRKRKGIREYPPIERKREGASSKYYPLRVERNLIEYSPREIEGRDFEYR